MITIRQLVSSAVLLLVLICNVTLAQRSVYAQSAVSPTLQIVGVDTSQFPLIDVTISGGNLPAPINSLPATITVDGTPIAIAADDTVQRGIQLALVVDTNQLVTRNDAGQSAFVELTGTLLDLVDANVFVRNRDWLAAYQLQGTVEPQLVQPWTQEPNQLFNGVVSKRPAEISDAPLTGEALIAIMGQMNEQAENANLSKVLLLFSAGADLADLTPILEAAQQDAVAVHVVELLAGAAHEPSAPLQTLATASGGHYTALTDPDMSTEVVKALAAARTVRTLQARVEASTPQELTVALTLPDGTLLNVNDSRAFGNLALTPATITVVSPKPEVNWDSLATDATLGAGTRLLPVEVTVDWPDDHARELVQVSYTLRGPSDFAQQTIRTEAPFDQATLPLSNVQDGTYTLEVRALDELGVEFDSAATTLQLINVSLPAHSQATAAADDASSTNQESPSAQPTTDEGRAADDNLTAAPLQQVENDAQPSDTVQIPGTSFSVSRSLLLWLLPVLLLLIGYLIYSERRERRGTQRAAQRAIDAPFVAAEGQNPLYDLRSGEAQKRSGKRYELDDAKEPNTQRYALREDHAANARYEDQGGGQAEPAYLMPELESILDRSEKQRTPQAQPAWRPRQEVDEWAADAEEITEVPLIEDEEATYRSEEVTRPTLGYLVRASSDPTLPKELPIYDIGATRGEGRQIYIGRHSQHNTIVINDKRISREHAAIIQREGRLYLRDNGSTAGTFLNGKRLDLGEELLLRHNDLISFGPVAYAFHLGSEEEATIRNA